MKTIPVSKTDGLARSRLATVGTDATLVDVAKLLSDTHISLVVVCASDGTMVGVITKTNIVRQFGGGRGNIGATVAADVMTRDVVSCRSAESLLELLALMEKRGYLHVPVLDESSKPIGVVNAGDALRALMADEKYEAALLRDYVMGIGYR